jgi:hypothetical protein
LIASTIGRWRRASSKKEDLTAVEDLAGLAQRVFGGVIVRAALCREIGRYVYWLVIRGSGGETRVKSLSTPASRSSHLGAGSIVPLIGDGARLAICRNAAGQAANCTLEDR